MIAAIILCFLIQVQSVAITDSSGFVNQSECVNSRIDTMEITKMWYLKGVSLQDSCRFEESNQALYEALKLARMVGDHRRMGKVMNFIAINYGDLGMRDECLKMSFQAHENLMLAGDSVLAANVKLNIGMDYANEGRYEDALSIQLEALELRLQCGDSSNIAAYYQHIGEIYKELGIREKWKSSLDVAHSLSANTKYASFKTRISILNDYGGIYEAEKRFDEAVTIYKDMYEQSKREDYLNGMATALSNLSPVYLNLKQNAKALECAREAYEIQMKRENIYGQISSFNQLGQVYFVMGKLKQSERNYKHGLKLAIDNAFVGEQKVSLDGLYKVSRQRGQWKEALQHHENWSNLEDSLQNIDLQEKLAELETRFQTEKKEQQIELLNRENALKSVALKYQKLAILGGSVFVLIVSLLVFWGVRQKRKQQLIKQNELEQKLLRSQMNPHFIFNSLGAIQNFMMKNEGRKAAFYLSSFSSLMRSILKNSREERITLQEEKQTLENYLNLHQLRLNDKLSFSISISEDLDAEEIMLPPMLVQPFVENAIIHGIEPMDGNGNVDLKFEKESDCLKITVTDDGKGIESKEQKSHVSYALQIFKERVANLKKMHGLDVDFRISQALPSGTIVTVKLPVNMIR